MKKNWGKKKKGKKFLGENLGFSHVWGKKTKQKKKKFFLTFKLYFLK
ncbi:hypothetical protein HYI43_11195 [Staphylococcus taiwanensis]|nr:hypothetical protein HYI43_11195 [Staphylococcus taiwanensis]